MTYLISKISILHTEINIKCNIYVKVHLNELGELGLIKDKIKEILMSYKDTGFMLPSYPECKVCG